MKRKQKKSTLPVPSSTPEEMAASYRSLLSVEEYEKLIQEINQPLPLAIRINPLKTSPGFPSRLSSKYGWQLEPVPFCKTGFRVITNSGPEVSSTLEHCLGMYYIQEAASMLPVELFSLPPDHGELILDMAASPGGKTTHLISRSGDRGLVLANDSSQGRVQALRIVLQNWGAVNYAITRFPAERFGDWYPNLFDKILLDAPCSMQGLRTAESHPSRPVTEKESLQLSRRQRAMLASAIRALRVGGEVVYSTCTLLPEEDEAVIDAVLHDFPSVIEVLDAQKILPAPAPGLRSYHEHDFTADMEKSIRLWPHRYHTAGFFACHLRKIAPLEGKATEPPFRPLEKVDFQVFSPKEEQEFCHAFSDWYGVDLEADLVENHRLLVRHYEQVYIFPQLLLDKFAGLPVQSAGILLGEETPDGFLPSQAWAERFGHLCTRSVIQLDEEDSAAWLNGMNMELSVSEEQSMNRYLVILSAEGMALGRAKQTGEGLKNLLRHRMR